MVSNVLGPPKMDILEGWVLETVMVLWVIVGLLGIGTLSR